MLGLGSRAGRLQIVLALVVVTAPGVNVGFGTEMPPLISGMMKSGSWTPVRSGPVATWPGTTGGRGGAASRGPDAPHPATSVAPQSAPISQRGKRLVMTCPDHGSPSHPPATTLRRERSERR